MYERLAADAEEALPFGALGFFDGLRLRAIGGPSRRGTGERSRFGVLKIVR
jgi:hypothetical protein